MAIYAVIVILIVGFGLIIQYKESFLVNKNLRKIYIFAVAILLALVSGFRDFSIGPDTEAYISIFKYIGISDFKSIIENTPLNLEKGYAVYSWALYQLVPDGHFFLLISMGICYISIGNWLYKNAKYPIESYLILICVFFTFFLTGLRQSIAIAILILAYEKVKQKKLIKFILIVLFAGLFHKTAFIFLLSYPLFRSKISPVKVIVVGIAVPLLYMFRNTIFLWITPIVGYEQYGLLDHGDPITYSLLLYTITFACVIFNKKIINNNFSATYYINSLLIACIFMPFVGLNGSMMRIVMYFSLYMVLVVPELVYVLNNKYVKAYLTMGVYSMLLFMFFRNIMSSTTYQFIFFF